MFSAQNLHMFSRLNNLASTSQNVGERRVTTLSFTAGQTGPRLRFHSLPSSIGLLQSLKKLDISIESLTKLPDELGNLKNLVFLNLASSITPSSSRLFQL